MAAEGGHLDVVKWLYYNRKEDCCTMKANEWASDCGRTNITKFLQELK